VPIPDSVFHDRGFCHKKFVKKYRLKLSLQNNYEKAFMVKIEYVDYSKIAREMKVLAAI